MSNAQPQAIYLKDYQQPNYFIEKTVLDFELFEDKTIVRSTLSLVRNQQNEDASLVLNGHDLELVSIAIDGRQLLSLIHI